MRQRISEIARKQGERGGKRKGGERFHGVPLEEAGSGLCDTSRMHGHGEGHQNARAEMIESIGLLIGS